MKITWKGDKTGLDLQPTWEVEEARIHTVARMKQDDGSLTDTIVLAIRVTQDQYRKLVADYGRDNIPTGILGVAVIKLYPGAVLWTLKPPSGYDHVIKTGGAYTAMEITA